MSDCDHASYSHKKGRLYCRTFNYQEARERYAAGETLTALAREYGVHRHTVRRAVDPEFRAKLTAAAYENIKKNHRQPCKGGCGRLVWIIGTEGRRNRSGYCPECHGRHRAVTVRPDSLLCTKCGEWQPDDAFPRQSAAKARRGRASLCRPCGTAARQAYRNRVKVPCSRCGEPCLPASERKPGARRHGHNFTDLCRACWQQLYGPGSAPSTRQEGPAHNPPPSA